MTRSAPVLLVVGAGLVLAACQAAGASLLPSASPAAGATFSAPAGSATVIPSAEATLPPSSCIEPRQEGSGTPGNGDLVGKIDQGRILFGLEGRGSAPGGAFAYAVIDKRGLHVTATDDWTLFHATWAPDGQIVFDSSRNGDRHLFRSNVDGSGVTQLTSSPGTSESSAAFIGPKRMVFTQWSCADIRDLGLHTANADGSGIADLTPDHAVGSPISDDQPAVSPDGKTIVFVRFSVNDDSVGALFSIPATGGTATRLTPDAAAMGYPRFSPDGKSVLFTEAGSNGQLSIWIVPAAGGKPREVTKLPTGMGAVEADWSPDGTEIVTKEYQAGSEDNELHLIRPDGSGDAVLWRGYLSSAETPHWGP